MLPSAKLPDASVSSLAAFKLRVAPSATVRPVNPPTLTPPATLSVPAVTFAAPVPRAVLLAATSVPPETVVSPT